MNLKFIRRYKLLIFALSLTITFILANIPSYALTVNEVPNPRQQNGGWVTDMVDMLSPQAENQLNQMISDLEKQNGTEIAIVTVPTTKPSATPKAFTTQLFSTWGIGKKGKNNGILFLVSKGDRRTEIETGKGIQKVLPNAKVGSIIREQVTPKFKRGNFEAGILAGTKSLIKELDTKTQNNNEYDTAVDLETKDKASFQDILLAILLTGIFLLIPFIILGLPIIFIVLSIVVFKKSRDTQCNQEKYRKPVKKYRKPVWKYIRLPSSGYIAKAFEYITKDNLSPSGKSRRNSPLFSRKAYCNVCSEPMQQVEATEIEALLTKPQKVARGIGSLKFKGWRCAKCATGKPHSHMHLLIFQSPSKASNCPTCKELTVTDIRTQVVRQATQYSSGTRRTWKKCQCCNYAITRDETIPKLSPPSTSSSSSSSCSSSDSGSSSSDFGGGSSDGGGAGDSW
ncbi:MAG: TPM domain-containing protein [Rivularia sp. (in: Bacteria)]|nr:TPM domain-containing protein [Rivularia sp. MS3]